MRRLFIVLFVVAAFAGSALAQESTQQVQNQITRKELKALAEAAPVVPLTLEALVAAADQFVSDGVYIAAVVPNIVVARKNGDGTVSTTCVTSETAAHTFMQQHFQQEPGKPAEQ